MVGDTFVIAGRLFQRIPVQKNWPSGSHPCQYCDLGYYFAKRRRTWKRDRCELCEKFKCDKRGNAKLTICRVSCPIDFKKGKQK